MSIKSYKKSASAVEAYLETLGKKVNFAQSLEVVARAHGAPNWNVLQGRVHHDATRKPGEASSADLQVYGAIAANYHKDVKTPVCRKCGTELEAEGWCTDETCPYHDWPQATPETALTGLTSNAIEALYKVKKRLSVFAEAHSDDRVYEAEFDATPWFAQASDDEILALAGIEWGGDAEADDVARYFSDLNQEVGTLFDYLTRVDVGFECHVNRLSARAWLKQNRPGVWARMLCEEHEVTLSEAQEDEIRGMWDWLGPHGNACEHSFDTIEEAALDAVRVLDLSDDGCIPEFPGIPPSTQVSHAKEVIRLITGAGRIVIDGTAVDVSDADYTGNDPDNEVFYFGWEVDGHKFSEKLTEQDLANARIEGSKVIIPGAEEELVLELFDNGPLTATETGPLILMGKPRLTDAELKRYTEANSQKLDVVLDVPWDYLGESSEDIDRLNDYVSERVTGSIADLVDIGYGVYHMTDAERAKHGTPDNYTVMLRVGANWEPSDF
jgi:hypothetical protein